LLAVEAEPLVSIEITQLQEVWVEVEQETLLKVVEALQVRPILAAVAVVDIAADLVL
jgi:hypothetical protein